MHKGNLNLVIPKKETAHNVQETLQRPHRIAPSAAMFWRPGTAQLQASATASFSKQKPISEEDSTQLPICKYRRNVLYALSQCQILLVVGAPNSGKSTQIPQFLLYAGYAEATTPSNSDSISNSNACMQIAVTQPHRTAAVALANRVAWEIGNETAANGRIIAHEESVDAKHTKVKILTEETLVRETALDPLLEKYAVVMVDGCDRRSMHGDLLCALLRKIVLRRPQLKVLLTATTTADVALFVSFFETAAKVCTFVVPSPRTHPVELHFAARPCVDFVAAACATVRDVHRRNSAGDIVVFLTGRREVVRAYEALTVAEDASTSSLLGLRCSRLNAATTGSWSAVDDEDDKVAAAFGTQQKVRRVLLASIDEAAAFPSSFLLRGVRFVVDGGRTKTTLFDAAAGVEKRLITWQAKSTAKWRSACAGYEAGGGGICFRLFTRAEYAAFRETPPPAIALCDVTTLVLHLKALGVRNVLQFDFLTPPSSTDAWARAIQNLHAIEALDDEGALTWNGFGRFAVLLPTPPIISRLLWAANEADCVQEMLTIAAMFALQDVFLPAAGEAKRMRWAAAEGDAFTLLNVYNAAAAASFSAVWAAANGVHVASMARAHYIRGVLQRHATQRFGMRFQRAASSPDALLRCIVQTLAAANGGRTARIASHGRSYVIQGCAEPVYAHPQSVLFRSAPQHVVFVRLTQTTRFFMEQLSWIKCEDWLKDL